jgi:Domain of unknown function (DUF4157)
MSRPSRGTFSRSTRRGAYHDLIDIGENYFCFNITLLDFIGAGVAENLYNNSCAAPHTIAPEVLEKLRPYFKSSFTSAVIHEDCNFSNRNAITFGEHIYFGRPNPANGVRGYRPMDAAGFADLAHELVHVLQYRREGFADFICRYWQECGIGAEISGGDSGVSCGFEQQAYMYQALVYDDVKRDGDGIFTCALDSREWNAGNVHSHSCVDKTLLDNCPDTFNPDQADSNGDLLGDACTLPNWFWAFF